VFFFIWFKKEKLFSSNMFLFEINNSTVASSGWRLSSLSNGRDSYWILSAKVSVVWGAAAQSPPAGRKSVGGRAAMIRRERRAHS
jgi:hypothetical protein